MSIRRADCKIASVVTIGSKGQIVFPKDLREKTKLKSNEKIALITCTKNGEVSCVILIKEERLRGTLSTIFEDII